MSTTLLLAILLVIAAVAFVLGRMRAGALSQGRSSALHSRPNYYGAFVIDPEGNNVEAVCHMPE